MYEEKKWRKIDWKNFGLKAIIVVLAMLLLIWIVPKLIPDQKEKKNSNKETKTVEKVLSKSFKENLETIKKTAKSYFTVERLPKEIGETATLTLQDMLDKKMILKFTDENGKFCDNTNSYAQMKKIANNEYDLKVQLSCEGITDHIIETFGCYNVCTSEGCKTEVKAPTNYHLSCPDGYSISGSFCYKNDHQKIEAKKNYSDQKEEITNAKINQRQSYNIYINPTVINSANKYSCPPGYIQSGIGVSTKCYKVLHTNKLSTTGKIYFCPSGTPNGSGPSMTCTKTTIKKAEVKKTYQDKPAIKKTTKTCPAGYPNREKDRCYYTTNAKKTITYGNWYVYTTKKSTTPLTPYTNTTEKMVYTGMSSGGGAIEYYNYTIYKRTSSAKYKCSSGNLSGTTCRHYKAVVVNTSYTCSTGKKIVNNSSTVCRVYSTTYYCPAGTPNGNGSSMTCKINEISKASIRNGKTIYYCPNGYNSSGSGSLMTCFKTDYTRVISKIENKKYSCPFGYKPSGNGINFKCIKTIKSDDMYYCEDANATLKDKKCYKKIPSEFLGYECPEGYNLNGSYCYKPTTEKIAAKEVCNNDISIEQDETNVSNTSLEKISAFNIIMYIFITLGTILVSIEILIYNKQRKEKSNYY